LDLLTYSIYIFVSLTRLFLNLYTAHSDVGGTLLYLCPTTVSQLPLLNKLSAVTLLYTCPTAASRLLLCS
jgi:hypothetical protein